MGKDEISKTYLIAEIAQAHDGSLGILHSYIDALAKAGVDAVKFQTHIAESESSALERFRIPFSYEDETRYDYWKRMELTAEQWAGLKDHCCQVGVDFISSPFSIAAFELLESIGCEVYKVASGEIENYLLLDALAETGKPIILSSGLSTIDDIKKAVDRFGDGEGKLAILQCTTQYPTPLDAVGINVLKYLKRLFPEAKVGLSDHSGSLFPGLVASAQGAEILEVHATFDRRMFGPDMSSSLEIHEIAFLARGLRAIDQLLDNDVDKDDVGDKLPLKEAFGKTLTLRAEKKKGERIRFDDLEAKKPGQRGVPAKEYHLVLNVPLKVNKKKGEFLQWSDFVYED